MNADPITLTDAWTAYEEVRKAKNRIAPFTPLARKRILTKLRMLAADGQDIEEVLWTSVEAGWTSIYPIKRKGWLPPSVTMPSKELDSTQRMLADQKAHVECVEAQRLDRLSKRSV